jgi:hypothetical protein
MRLAGKVALITGAAAGVEGQGYTAVAQRHEWSIARTLLGRLSTADEVAYGVLSPISDESFYVT